jgi:hypothetical protein
MVTYYLKDCIRRVLCVRKCLRALSYAFFLYAMFLAPTQLFA